MKKIIFAVLFAGCDSNFHQPASCKLNGGGHLPDTMTTANTEEQHLRTSDEEPTQCFKDSLAHARAYNTSK